MYSMPHWLLRNSKSRTVALQPDDWIALAADPDEIAVVDPFLLQEFDGGHRLGANKEEVGPARHFVIRFGQGVRIVWWSVRRAASNGTGQVPTDKDLGVSAQAARSTRNGLSALTRLLVGPTLSLRSGLVHVWKSCGMRS